MKKLILVIISIFIYNCYAISQIVCNLDSKSDSATLFLNEAVVGIGPLGNMSYGIATRDIIDSLELTAYPIMKNLPDSLNNLIEYCFILNNFQFVYQNYRNGIYSKDYFLNEATKQKWNLNDTIYLTEKIVKNTISVAAGFNSQKIGKYIIDANNNGDYSDDTLRTLYGTLYRQEDVVDNAHYVNYEYFNGKSVIQDKILFLAMSQLGSDNLSLMFSFPQFRYGKLIFNKKAYLVCSNYYNPEQVIFLVPDRPYFSSISNDKAVKPHQYVNFGDTYYQYIPVSQNSDKIKLQKIDFSDGNSTNQNVKSTQRKLAPISNQVGLTAPSLSGTNILDDSLISLNLNKGKYVFLDFWTTFCGPCLMELPNLKMVYDKFSRDQFEIIGIVGDGTKGKLKKFLKDRNVTWPNIDADAFTTNKIGYTINSYPTSYLIAPDGKIITTNLRGDQLMNKLEMLNIKKNNVP